MFRCIGYIDCSEDASAIISKTRLSRYGLILGGYVNVQHADRAVYMSIKKKSSLSVF
jgi:hypothetical protein